MADKRPRVSRQQVQRRRAAAKRMDRVVQEMADWERDNGRPSESSTDMLRRVRGYAKT